MFCPQHKMDSEVLLWFFWGFFFVKTEIPLTMSQKAKELGSITHHDPVASVPSISSNPFPFTCTSTCLTDQVAS